MAGDERVSVNSETADELITDDALESFLNRENDEKSPKESKPKRGKGVIILIAAVLAVAALTVTLIMINKSPYPESGDSYVEAQLRSTVDEAGVHTVQAPTDSDGEPVQNGSGTLLNYIPANIERIEVSNPDGSFVINAHTHEGEATEYSLEGYEDFDLQTGMPDNVANDSAALSFITIASTGGRLGEFGLDSPRATVTVSYNDATKAVIRVGDEAPASAGVYVAFGSTEEVYLVSDEAVDSFLYKLTDFISLSVTDSAENVDDSTFTRLTLSGSRYPESIVLEPNADEAIDCSYKLTSPIKTFAAEYAAADIAGSVRGLYASEVAAIIGSDSGLTKFGLSESYAEVKAEYPDVTVNLRASEADEAGDVYLVNLSGNRRVIYKIQLGAVSWANSSLEALTPDTALSVKREALASITLDTDDISVKIDVDTKTQTVENDEGESEEVTTTEAYIGGERMSDESFTTLFQDLKALPCERSSVSASGKALLTISYAYSTGRSADELVIYDGGSGKYPVTLNGTAIGTTSKSYAEKLINSVKGIDNQE